MSGCKRSRPAADRASEKKEDRPRADGVLILAYQLPKKERIGCQVHLLKEGDKRKVAIELGATKRRRFYPKSDSYWSRPATFAHKETISRVGFVWWSAGMKKAGSVFRARDLDRPEHHELSISADKWAFSCVALSGERGSSIEGTVDQGVPSVTARRTLAAKQVTAAALQPVLQALVGM